MISRIWRHQVQDRDHKFPFEIPGLPRSGRVTSIGLTDELRESTAVPSKYDDGPRLSPFVRFAKNPYVRAVGLGVGAVPAVLIGMVNTSEATMREPPGPIVPGADIIAAATFSPAGQPVLRLGDQGPAVTVLQLRLAQLGYPSGNAPGAFDQTLKDSVISYQTHRELPAQGVVDQATWDALAGLNVRNVRTEAPRVEVGHTDFIPSADWNPATQPVLQLGSRNAAVRQLQERLWRLGYEVGTPDGSFGAKTRAAVVEYQVDQNLPLSSRVNGAMWQRLVMAQPLRAVPPALTPGGTPIRIVYAPRSEEARALFREAALAADLPVAWADSLGLHRLLAAESQGQVGVPNYTYGSRRFQEERFREVHAELRLGIRSTRSSATGLGQLLLDNVEIYYPSGRAGIGDPLEEAIGMLRYIEARYGNPDAAWQRYNDFHEGY
jgi:peptidoglycan hydrolase-like protein with peptidoglycan-binding domain